MWKQSSKPVVQKVTLALANHYASMEAAPNDRPLSERRVAIYKKLVENGQFRPVTWATVECKETSTIYRVNGKHTSTLFSRLGDKLPSLNLFAQIEHYECDTLEDVAQLYSTFDSREQMRSVDDINRSFAASDSRLSLIETKTLSKIVGGIAMGVFGQDYANRRHAERAELILEYPYFALFAEQIINKNGSSHKHWLRRVPVVAAMFGAYNKNKKEAALFWEAVRDQSDPDPKSASRTLAVYLMTTKVKSPANNARKRSAVATVLEVYVKSIKAWNAFRSGSQVTLRFNQGNNIPEFL